MSKWKYDGYTKTKIGSGRHARMIEHRIYICTVCQKPIRIETTVKPPMICPSCGADMRSTEELG